ncbi:MAG: helix-turn-helix domain-containing GNAT family N-acetyltransferase [Bacteroidota bacterium]
MSPKLFELTGPLAIGTRLRRLSDQITQASKQLFADYETNLRPRWFSVFFLLSNGHAHTVSELAELMQQTHPSICRTLREMMEAKLVSEAPDPEDGRKSNYSLTDHGKTIAKRLSGQIDDVDCTIAELISTSEHDLWQAINEWEILLEKKNLVQRVRTARKARLRGQVQMVDFEPDHAEAFRDLNFQWIEQYFTIEEADRAALEHPQSYILDKGGHIIIALLAGEPVGTCALIKMDSLEYDYELAKMAVAPRAQGLGIGFQLGEAILKKASVLGANTVYLESNTKLQPALALYRKLGFEEVVGQSSPYARANIKMAVKLAKN